MATLAQRLRQLLDLCQYLVIPIFCPVVLVLALTCQSRGFTFIFGIFESFYSLTYIPSESPSSLAWIGTIQTALLVIIGILAGPLFDLGAFRMMLIAGSFLVLLGLFMLSLSTAYYQIFLSQGVCVGIGGGLLYVPSLALVSKSFQRHRTIAMGIVTCGVGLGRDKLHSYATLTSAGLTVNYQAASSTPQHSNLSSPNSVSTGQSESSVSLQQESSQSRYQSSRSLFHEVQTIPALFANSSIPLRYMMDHSSSFQSPPSSSSSATWCLSSIYLPSVKS